MRVVVAGVGFPELNSAVISAHHEGRLDFLGFIDDNVNSGFETKSGFPILGSWGVVQNYDAFVINSVAKNCEARYMAQVRLESLGGKLVGFHNADQIPSDSSLDPSAIVLNQGFVGQEVRIERHSVVHIGAYLAHNVYVGVNTFIGPRVICLGRVKIGNNTFVGAGAIISNGISIGDNVVVAAGSVIFNNIPDGSTVAGNPSVILGKL